MLIPTMSGRCYTDADVFGREQRQLFERMWMCVVRSADLAAPGDWRTVDVGREQLIVTRDRGGEIRALFNVCRHRGMRVCNAEQGNSRRPRCGYHSWTYDLDGTLLAAPNLARMPDLDTTAYGLLTMHVREWLGYVWVCLADEAPSFEETVYGEVVARLGELRNLDNYRIESLALGRRIRYDVAANWKLIVENFQECYHCATIHPELTAVLPEFRSGWAAQAFVNHGAEFAATAEGFTVDGSAGVTTIDSIDADQDRKYYALTIRPNVFVHLVPDHVIVHRMFPVAADRTIVECDWLFDAAVVSSGVDLSRSVELFHRVNEQDFLACEQTQPSMSSRVYAEGGVLVPAEHHIADFHRWVQDRIDG